MEGQVGAVLERLYYQDTPLSVPERTLPGTQAKHIPVYGPGVPPRRHPDVALTLPWAAHMTPPILPPKALTREYEIFSEILQAVPKTPHTKRRRYHWIYKDTCCIIDARVALHRDPT